jgi:uncharacterized protein (TIGR03083 family)
MPDPLEALRGECELVSQTVLGLPEARFTEATRLPAWNVGELLGHMYRDIDRINTALTTDPPAAADTDSVSYWTRYDPATDGPDIAQRAREVAAGYESGQALAAGWDEMWRRALGQAETTDRERVVVTWGPALTFDEFLRTRVLEITVHRMDLNDALDLPPDPTEAGLEVTEEILLALLGQALPEGLGWDGPSFLEKGTGRSALTDAERDTLGRLADEFPLLA